MLISLSHVWVQVWPRDRPKLFPIENKYTEGPSGLMKRRCKIYLNACSLCAVNTVCEEVIFPRLQTTVLKRPALVNFMDVIVRVAVAPDGLVKLLQDYFLDEWARGAKVDVWWEFCFILIKSKRSSKNEKVTHEKDLNEIRAQISEIFDIRIEPS